MPSSAPGNKSGMKSESETNVAKKNGNYSYVYIYIYICIHTCVYNIYNVYLHTHMCIDIKIRS